MNNNGIVRSIDDLGRITIPKEYRNTLNIRNNELISISISDDKIILQKQVNKIDIKDLVKQFMYNFYDPKSYNTYISDSDFNILLNKLENTITEFIDRYNIEK